MIVTRKSLAFSVIPPLHIARLRHPTRCSVSKPPEEPPPTAPTSLPEKEKKPTKQESLPPPPLPQSPNLFEVLGERTLDTIDDVYLHYSRMFRVAVSDATRPTGKPRIVLLGSGWAAHSFIK
eukprot:IDg16882t1